MTNLCEFFLFDIQANAYCLAFHQAQKLKQLALCSAKFVKKLPNLTKLFS